MILTIRTEKPKAELGLYKGSDRQAYDVWLADRRLSADVHKKISSLLKAGKIDISELTGLVLYSGPGSFTGLRIGASVANTLASELDIPIAASNGDDWIKRGLRLLAEQPDNRLAVLDYGSPPKTTKPKK